MPGMMILTIIRFLFRYTDNRCDLCEKKGMKKFYHVCTKGLEDDVIFRKDTDYVAGMNFGPISLLGLAIKILAFTLMSNHFHFLLYGTYDEVVAFIETYKSLIGRYSRHTYGVPEILRRIHTGVYAIGDSLEELKQKLAYVLNNPVAAGVNVFPLLYEWGSGRCYFVECNSRDVQTELSSFTVREQVKMLHSNKRLPQDYRLRSGYVDPSCYVDCQMVEKLFVRASSLSYYLSKVNRRDSTMVLSDGILINVVDEILDKQYGGLRPNEMPKESLGVLVLDLNRRFNASPKQLARILKLKVQDVVAVLKR